MKMKSPRLVLSLLSLAALAVSLSACSFSLAADITPPPGAVINPVAQPSTPVSGPLFPQTPPDPQNGALIYAQKCAACHGPTGLGDGERAAQLPNPVAQIGLPEVARQATPSGWYLQVTQGNLERFMPPFNSLSDAERWDVVAYSFQLSASRDSLAQGEALYAENCARCHGPQGKGDGPEAARLSPPPASFLNQAFMAEKTGQALFEAMSNGMGQQMPAYAGQLGEAERWAMVDYLRALTFKPAGELAGLPGAAAPAAPITTTAAISPTTGLTATVGLAASNGFGAVSGTIINESGGSVPEGLKVTLHAFDDMQIVFTQTTTSDAQGGYLFDNVEMPAGRAFLTTVEYSETTYGSDIGSADPATPAILLPVSIFDTTTDRSVITIDRLHLFFEQLDEQTMRVVELSIMSNNSNKTLVAAEQGAPVVEFVLPEGFANLSFQDGSELGGRYQATTAGFGDTLPVRPGAGAYQVIYSYTLPYDRKLELVQQISMPVDAVVILAPEGSFKISGAGVTDAGVQDVQGTQYHMYNVSRLNQGETLRLTVSSAAGLAAGLPALAAGSTGGMLLGAAVFGAALIAAGFWLYRRAAGQTAETAGAADDEELEDETPAPRRAAGKAARGGSEDSAEALMDAILALDDLYQAGQLPEAAYRQRRQELKAQLKERLAE